MKKFNWSALATIIATIVAIGSVVAAHYDGINSAVSQADDYTDKQVSFLRTDMKELLEDQKEVLQLLRK